MEAEAGSHGAWNPGAVRGFDCRLRIAVMRLSRDKELWMAALLIEKTRGVQTAEYIETRRRKFASIGDDGGAKLWTEIGAKLAALTPDC